jgi:hypothetical protein
VPGGPNNKTPLHALLKPLNNYGIANGSNTASSSTSLAFWRSAMSSNVTLGLNYTTSLYKDLIN